MTRSRIITIAFAAALAAVQTAGPVSAQSDGNHRLSVTVSFGVGLNTAQPGNPLNHHVLPNTIEIKAGGVVNFAVAGFHQIVVYHPGKRAEDVILPVDPMALFINDATNRYYLGIVPAGGPLNTPATANPSNAVNRVEPVSFAEPGVYLVICNVTPHFRDGMFAYVRVTS
jgi:plastocyanin